MQVTDYRVLESGTRVRVSHENDHDELWKRVRLLRREEQDLLELSLKLGATQRQIGRMFKRSPGAVSRQLRQIGRRLHNPLVIVLLDPRCRLEPSYRQMGVEHFLVGLTSVEIARKHEIPRARVLRILQLVRLWWRDVRGMRVRE